MTRTEHVRVLVLLVAAVLATLLVAGIEPARATFSGANGKIAFQSDRDGDDEIFVMNPDSSGQTSLTDNPAEDSSPAVSADGKKIAFTSRRDGNQEIYGAPCIGTDEMFGGEGDDDIHSGKGDDQRVGASSGLVGGPGNNKINGGNGDDFLDAGAPGFEDEVKGGKGDDLVVAQDGVKDVVDCGKGTDTVFFDEESDEVKNCEFKNPT